ncbi:hypothetical protein ACN27F_10610 [Solwaraspora sp. WMMB335]|uniref:hypothetical protein n=1 Tax=Solwaraspora sp. WMMB335 TaxID=3404118 RepID=UPI003B960345
MHRKDYDELADVIGNVTANMLTNPAALPESITPAQARELIHEFVRGMAWWFPNFNRHFDETRFLRACGVPLWEEPSSSPTPQGGIEAAPDRKAEIRPATQPASANKPTRPQVTSLADGPATLPAGETAGPSDAETHPVALAKASGPPGGSGPATSPGSEAPSLPLPDQGPTRRTGATPRRPDIGHPTRR